MQTFGENVFDSTVKHQIHLERFKTKTVRDVIEILNGVEADIVDQIRTLEDGWTRRRLEAMLKEVGRTNARAFSELRARLGDGVNNFAESELGFVTSQLNAALPGQISTVLEFIAPADPLLFVAAEQPFKEKFVQGRKLSEWIDGLELRDRARLESGIRTGFLEGEGVEKIVRRVRGRRVLKYRDGLREVTRRETEALVRTTVQAASTAAREEVYKSNEPLINRIRFIATLDGRTTMICRSLDQEEFLVDDGPRPPMHMRCRSTTIPMIKSWAELGFDKGGDTPKHLRPYVRDKRRMGSIPKADRKALVGRVDSDISYDKWLRNQDRDFVESVMGQRKTKLFLDGGLSMDKFVDAGYVREYSLTELKVLQPKAFARAGL